LCRFLNFPVLRFKRGRFQADLEPVLWVISASFLWVIFGLRFTVRDPGVSVRQALRILRFGGAFLKNLKNRTETALHKGGH
jgi:hypothetical protein